MRYFFQISYKGTNYHGWQIQKNAISIQQVIQEKLSQITNENIEILGSGRTDAGVHASQQYFHADFTSKIDSDNIKYSLNATLPKDIVIHSINKVIPEAHARFDAISRSYRYVMIPLKDPFRLNEAYIYQRPIDLDKLNAASKIFIGKFNFKSFSKVKTQVNNFNCEIQDAFWQQEGACTVFHITANRFLRGMVRAIVGTLLMVNEGKLQVRAIREIMEAHDRSEAGRSVPPDGLYLSQIMYPIRIFEI